MSYDQTYSFKYTKLETIRNRDGAYDVSYSYRTHVDPKSPKNFNFSVIMRGFKTKEEAQKGTYRTYI